MNHDRDADAIEIARIAATLCAGDALLCPLDAVVKAQVILYAARSIAAPKPSPKPSGDIQEELVGTMGDHFEDDVLKRLGIDPAEPWNRRTSPFRAFTFKQAAECVVTEKTKVRTKKDGRWSPEDCLREFHAWRFYVSDCFSEWHGAWPYQFTQDLMSGECAVPITYEAIRKAALGYGLDLSPVEISRDAAEAHGKKWKDDNPHYSLHMIADALSLYPKWRKAYGAQRKVDGAAKGAGDIKAANELSTKGQPRKKRKIVNP